MVRARLSHCSTNLVIVVPIQAMLELHVVSSKETVTLLITSNAHTSIRARTSSSPVTFFFLSYFTLFLLTNISSFQSVRIRIDRRVIRTEETSINSRQGSPQSGETERSWSDRMLFLSSLFSSFLSRKVR